METIYLFAILLDLILKGIKQREKKSHASLSPPGPGNDLSPPDGERSYRRSLQVWWVDKKKDDFDQKTGEILNGFPNGRRSSHRRQIRSRSNRKGEAFTPKPRRDDQDRTPHKTLHRCEQLLPQNLQRRRPSLLLERKPSQRHTLFPYTGYFKNLLGCSKEKHGYFKWFAGNVASGSAAGATTSLFLYHLDYARTRLGTDAKECSVSGKRQFTGMVDVYRKTLSSDGVKGLYRGFGVSILGITLYRGMYFGMYDTIKPIVLVGSLEGNFLASFLLGWSITTSAGVIAYPFDTLRRRMMLTSGQPVKYRNSVHALREILKTEGFCALYRGVTANMLLGVAGAGVLAGYDQLHRIAYKHWAQ
ncbi:ADP,ATP carrier protein ER-ANT1-like [Raphanus sativus]|uniref:ADP/ATP translocase n=1 Tax=Raphanus sativus TaxID=3726 RepID=A0A9W3D3I5_RAPSA|nr:ADP,ATP carrier protein ER-ANT1-like [Raphanus sativus]